MYLLNLRNPGGCLGDNMPQKMIPTRECGHFAEASMVYYDTEGYLNLICLPCFIKKMDFILKRLGDSEGFGVCERIRPEDYAKKYGGQKS